MSRIMLAASAAALVFLPARVALAQGAPSGGTAPTATSTAAWHGARALPELGAERVSSVYSVR